MNTPPAAGPDFAALLRPGDAVVCSQGLAEPVGLTRRLIEQRHAVGPLEVLLGMGLAGTFDPACTDMLQLRSWCATGTNGALASAGRLDILPVHYGDMQSLFASGVLRCDVALLSASSADGEGRLGLGLNCDYVIEAARRARLVVVEVNDRLPQVPGALLPEDIRPHVVVRVSRPPLEMPGSAASPGADEQAIARHVAGLVPDGATLVPGIGSLPDIVLAGLRQHRDLGIHAGILVDGVVDLVEAGAVTNARKTLDRGVSVAGLLMGSRRLFEFAHRNPQVRLAPTSYTHAIEVLAALPQVVALTGAIEVDLTGQVNAETAAGRYVGAVGGQLEVVRGARASRGGLAITMLPATARRGTVSRIVARLPDAVVTTPRADVDRVVTEFGVAELRGKGMSERIEAMLAIAHPDFRAALAQEGERLAGRAASKR